MKSTLAGPAGWKYIRRHLRAQLFMVTLSLTTFCTSLAYLFCRATQTDRLLHFPGQSTIGTMEAGPARRAMLGTPSAASGPRRREDLLTPAKPAKPALEYLLDKGMPATSRPAAGTSNPDNDDAEEECIFGQHSGYEYIRQLQDGMQPVCTPHAGGGTELLPSQLRCSFRSDGAPEAFCAGSHLALNLQKLQAFYGIERTRGELKRGMTGLLRGSCSVQQPSSADMAPVPQPQLLWRRQGTGPHPVQGSTSWSADLSGWRADKFGLGGQRWLRTSFVNASQQQPINCVSWVEHPLYFVADRYDPWNPWHALEDITHAFESYALMGWGQEAQVVVGDALDEDKLWEGFTYAPLWRKAFSPLRPPTTLRALAEGVLRSHQGELPPGAALCFKEAAWSVHGGLSLLSRSKRQLTACVNSTMVNALVSFLLDRLALAEVLPASHGSSKGSRSRSRSSSGGGGGTRDVSSSMRGGSSFSSSGGSLRGSKLTSRRAASSPTWARLQQSPADAEKQAAARALRLLSDRWEPGMPALKVVWALRETRAEHQDAILRLFHEHLGAAGVQVLPVDLGSMGIEDQIQLVRQADVFAGYHGAALTLALFMPEQSALVEIIESYRCHCYTNVAAWRGRPYYLLRSDDSLSFPYEVLATVATALELVARRVAASAAGVAPGLVPNAFHIKLGSNWSETYMTALFEVQR